MNFAIVIIIYVSVFGILLKVKGVDHIEVTWLYNSIDKKQNVLLNTLS